MLPEDVDIDLDAVTIPFDWQALFGRGGPVDVEIGSGKGRFLNAMAETHPERSFLAVERAAKYHRMECQRAARRGLRNVRLVRTTAEDLLIRLVPPGSVETVYVLFPDPWPKKRHHKRRLFTDETVQAMARVLVPGGRLMVKSDHPDYAEVIGETLARAAGLRAIDAPAAFDGLPRSGFEVKYEVEGRPIATYAYEKIEAPAEGTAEAP